MALIHAHQHCARPKWHLGSGARLCPPAFPALPLVALLLPAVLQALVDLLRLPGLKVVQRAAYVLHGLGRLYIEQVPFRRHCQGLGNLYQRVEAIIC